MPWTTDRYPAAMQHLAPPVRRKAIDVANAVLVENGDEGSAIRIGIARAKAWAIRNDIALEDQPPDAAPAPPAPQPATIAVHHWRR